MAGREASGALQPRGLGLFGCAATPSKAEAAAAAPAPSSSAWTDASAEPTLSMLRPADSCDPTVEGPAAKRPRLARQSSHGYGLQQAGGWRAGCAAGSASLCDSDSEGEEAVVSRKHPTPHKGASVQPSARRAPAQHPPPTWASSLGSAGAAAASPAAVAPSARRQMDQVGWWVLRQPSPPPLLLMPHHQRQHPHPRLHLPGSQHHPTCPSPPICFPAMLPPQAVDVRMEVTGGAGGGAEEEEAGGGSCSDMDEDEGDECFAGPWLHLPYPHPLDVEE